MSQYTITSLFKQENSEFPKVKKWEDKYYIRTKCIHDIIDYINFKYSNHGKTWFEIFSEVTITGEITIKNETIVLTKINSK